jgi:hypothetical protein
MNIHSVLHFVDVTRYDSGTELSMKRPIKKHGLMLRFVDNPLRCQIGDKSLEVIQ